MSSTYIRCAFSQFFYLTFYFIYSSPLILSLTLCFFYFYFYFFKLNIYSLNLALCLHLAINSLFFCSVWVCVCGGIVSTHFLLLDLSTFVWNQTKEYGFTLKIATKLGSRRYPTESITDAAYADGVVLLTNVHTQAESLLHSRQQVALVSTWIQKKTEYMCFNPKRDLSTLSSRSMKVIDRFKYLEGSVL